MAGLRRITYLWKEADAARNYATAVSLHSHTNQSKETLDFLANLGNQYPLLRPWITRYERRSRERGRIPLNFAAAYWTTPLTPKPSAHTRMTLSFASVPVRASTTGIYPKGALTGVLKVVLT